MLDREASMQAKQAGLELRETADGLVLSGDGMELQVDFSRLLPRLHPHKLNRELLIRAAKIKGADAPLSAFDATAGLGEDALLLAAAGFSVTLCEHNPVIAALLRDGIQRAGRDPRLASVVARMELLEGDSKAMLASLSSPPDVIYLDPMFPERSKSAAVKKKFQLLHRLEKPCDDAEALLRAAIAASPRKVVLKRPAKGPLLADIKPSYSLEGTTVRYDCFVLPRS